MTLKICFRDDFSFYVDFNLWTPGHRVGGDFAVMDGAYDLLWPMGGPVLLGFSCMVAMAL